MLKRTEESKLTSWYFEIDRRLLGCVLLLVFIGMVFAVSAGSVAAERIGRSWYYFFLKGIPFYIGGLIVLFAASLLKKKQIFWLSVANVIGGMGLLFYTLVHPHKIKGSVRFVVSPLGNIMPSDIMKPGFIVLTAWFFTVMGEKYGSNMFLNKDAWRLRWLSWWTYLAIFIPALFIIFKHPDVGTAGLYLGTLGGMLLVAGLPLKLLPILVGLAGVGSVAAYFMMPHVHRRVDAFFTGKGDSFQVDQSVESIQHGGLLGSGDDAFVKQSLPDAHTDFIFAAIAEDFGAIMACGVLCLLLYVLMRLISDAYATRDKFVFFVTSGAAMLFGTQICINMMSTLHLMPPKGMTLPFISYGGSSLLSYCCLFGIVLALVREDKWER